MPRSFPTSINDAIRPARVCNELDDLAEWGVDDLIGAVRPELYPIPGRRCCRDCGSGSGTDDHRGVLSRNCCCTKVSERWPGSGVGGDPEPDTCPPCGRNPDDQFQCRSLATCLSPQVGFSRAIRRINAWRSLGRRGRPVGQDVRKDAIGSASRA